MPLCVQIYLKASVSMAGFSLWVTDTAGFRANSQLNSPLRHEENADGWIRWFDLVGEKKKKLRIEFPSQQKIHRKLLKVKVPPRCFIPNVYFTFKRKKHVVPFLRKTTNLAEELEVCGSSHCLCSLICCVSCVSCVIFLWCVRLSAQFFLPLFP